MTKLIFRLNKYAACWECILPEERIYMHKYPPSHTLVSIQYDTLSSHEIFESIHEAHTYLGLKYTAEVKYRDPTEEEHPRKDLLEEYI